MIILVDKPFGITSYDCVEKIKRIYASEKVGHGGTLDPYASGLLIVAVGKDTKLLSRFLHGHKTYVTTIDFSISSDTRDLQFWKDITYFPTHKQPQTIEIDGNHILFPTKQEITNQLETMRGIHSFPLTPFSAKKIQGKKLYEYAREGNPMYLDTPMEVIDCTLEQYAFPSITVRFTVGSGTYIRSLGYRMGKQWGLGGTITALRRISVGDFFLSQ